MSFPSSGALESGSAFAGVAFLGLAWLATYFLHSTILVGFAALAIRTLRRRPTRSVWLRERMLRLALFGGLVTASAQLALGHQPLGGSLSLEPEGLRPQSALPADRGPESRRLGSRFEVARDAPGPREAAAPGDQPVRAVTGSGPGSSDSRAQRSAHDTGEPVAFEPRIRAPLWPSVLRTEGESRFASPIDPAPSTPRPSPAWSQGSATLPAELALLLFGLWALVFAGLVGRLACGWLFLRRRLRERRTVTGPLAREFEDLRRRAGVYFPVRLSTGAAHSVPITFGVWRREICLPERVLERFTAAEVRVILAHELAHAKRRDPAWFLAYALFERAFCFQPLNRIVHRELLATAELACDDHAIRLTGARLELASTLTEIADWLVGPRLRVPVATMACEPSRLGGRVLRLLEEPQDAPAPRSRPMWLGAAWAAVVGVGVLAPGVVAAQVEQRSERQNRDETDEVARRAAPHRGRESSAGERAGSPDPPRDAEPARRASPTAEGEDARPGPARGVSFALQLNRELFTSELSLLEDELGSLHRDVRRLERPELSAAVEEIEHRLESLSTRHARVDQLLTRLFGDPELHDDVGDAPRADVPSESP